MKFLAISALFATASAQCDPHCTGLLVTPQQQKPESKWGSFKHSVTHGADEFADDFKSMFLQELHNAGQLQEQYGLQELYPEYGQLQEQYMMNPKT